MRTIIAGSRTATDYTYLCRAIESVYWWPSVVLSGTARGADKMGERWANHNSIPIERYPADWDRYGRSAGYRRNVDMARNAEALIALWDGQSRGTKHMIDIGCGAGLVVFVWRIDMPNGGLL